MFLNVLRERTHDCHDRVEAAINIFDRCRRPTTYAELLQRYYSFYVPLEIIIGHHSAAQQFGFERRRKSHLLRRDLEALSVPPTLLPCPTLPDLSGSCGMAGCLYVLEGATLGGRIIARHLWETLQIGPENGASFFHGYGHDTGRLWKAFGGALEAVASDPACQEGIISGARDTFTCFERWLRQGESNVTH